MPDLIYIQTNNSHAGRTEFVFEGYLGDIAQRGYFETRDEDDPSVLILIPLSDLKTGIRIAERNRFGIGKNESRVRTHDEMMQLLEPLRAQCQREQVVVPINMKGGEKQ